MNVSGVWKDALWLMEEYVEKYGQIHVVAGPVFDYNSDGLADSLSDIHRYSSMTYSMAEAAFARFVF